MLSRIATTAAAAVPRRRQQQQRLLSTAVVTATRNNNGIVMNPIIRLRQTPTMTIRRSFYYGDAKANLDMHLVPRFTPLEEFTMDCTAWFVAFAILWTPEHDFDDLDYQNLEEMEDKAERDASQKKRQQQQIKRRKQFQKQQQSDSHHANDSNQNNDSSSSQGDHHDHHH